MGGLQAAVREPINLSKISSVVQGKKEFPTAFLERLLEAYRTYSSIDLEAAENHRAINIAFTAQSDPDICRKLQRIDVFERKNLSELVGIAEKAFDDRASQDNRQIKKMAKVLALKKGREENEQ